MSQSKEARRQIDSGKLDIDRRRKDNRRSEDRRVWLDTVYEDIYVRSYVNQIHPRFQVSIHAFSNMDEEPSRGEWAANTLAIEDAQQARGMRSLSVFARDMIAKGLVIDSKGKELQLSTLPTVEYIDLVLKAG